MLVKVLDIKSMTKPKEKPSKKINQPNTTIFIHIVLIRMHFRFYSICITHILYVLFKKPMNKEIK